MLVVNIDVSDGLVNGTSGVFYIVTSNNHMVNSVLVKFDNQQVGIKAIQTSPYWASFPDAVPIGKYEVVFRAKHKCGSEITHLQFLLKLAYNTQSARREIVDMKGGRFNPGQAYATFRSSQNTMTANYDFQYLCHWTQSSCKLSKLQHHDNHVTIALLNVRSIAAKLG